MQFSPADIPVSALREAARRPEVVAAMRDLYTAAQHLIDSRAPVCWNKGDCCRFGQFGHRLYVTALEVVYYLATAGDPATAENAHGTEPASMLLVAEDACPHARDGKCQARSRRPLGCRIFYCDPAAQHWQGPLTEDMLGELRRLHDDLQVPYFYAEWLTVLQALSRDPS